MTLVEEEIQEYAEENHQIHKDDRAHPALKIQLDLLGQYQVNTKQRRKHVAKRFARVHDGGLPMVVEYIRIFRADKQRKEHPHPQKRNGVVGILLRFVIHKTGQRDQGEREGTDIAQRFKPIIQPTVFVHAQIPNEIEDQIANDKNNVENFDVDFITI